jgi:transcriptional repressor NrdR
LVVKKDGRREPFDRMKILGGLHRACVKRPVSAESLERLVDDLERELVETGEKEVSSTAVGERVMDALRDLDHVAYVRFASVYRQFKDTNEFLSELSQLLSPERAERGASRRLERERLGGARPQAASDEAEETPPSTNLLKDRG